MTEHSPGVSLGEQTLAWLEARSHNADPPPWQAFVEGRDHTSGDSFIMVGAEPERSADMYVSRDAGPARSADLDVIAAARTYLPLLTAEVRRLRSERATDGLDLNGSPGRADGGAADPQS